MNQVLLFTDGSYHPQTKVGFGAILFVNAENMQKKEVRLERFTNTSSTKLELETLLFALNLLEHKNPSIKVYTDSQNIVNLPNRRARLETNNYISKAGILSKNHLLYKQFYCLYDTLNLEIIKVKGHNKSSVKSKIDDLFTIVDKASRRALRLELKGDSQ